MNVYINGIGIISRCACSKEELTEAVSGKTTAWKELPIVFPIGIPSSKLRRNSRYNKLACASADQALKDAHIPERMEQGLDGHQIGTILSTGYGAAEYSSVFADSVVKGDPNGCSPSVFSGSVPNSCIGQICILNGLKGFSTILAGGDPVEYASLLLNSKRAEYILTGSVEEYFAPLYEAFGRIEVMNGSVLSEGSAMAVLSRIPDERSCCRISGFSGAYLGKSPYLHSAEEFQAGEQILAGIFQKFSGADAFFAAANGTRFDDLEERAVRTVFPDIMIKKPKSLFGETLGCGYMMNILCAASSIRNGCFRSVISAGMDMIGNYTCVLLEAC